MEKVIEDATVLTDQPVNQDNVVEFENKAVCQFCKQLGEKIVIEEWRKKIDAHLVVTLSGCDENKPFYHVHFGIDTANDIVLNRMIEVIKSEWSKIKQK